MRLEGFYSVHPDTLRFKILANLLSCLFPQKPFFFFLKNFIFETDEQLKIFCLILSYDSSFALIKTFLCLIKNHKLLYTFAVYKGGDPNLQSHFA